MIETLMALWNRGLGGRLLVITISFCCICISISLLFVTAGNAWGSLFTRGRAGGEATRVVMVTSILVTTTAPASTSTSPLATTPTIMPNPCIASATGVSVLSTQISATKSNERSSSPRHRTTASPAQRHKTPTPGVTVIALKSPSPTFPVEMPTATATQTTITTPMPTTVPTLTPTIVATPTATPTSTTTPGATPTGTTTPGIMPTVTVTDTITPTLTAPAGSPTATTTATATASGTGAAHTSGGSSIVSGTSSNADTDQAGRNCFSDSLAQSGAGAMLSLLRNLLWIILVSSLLGTGLFCIQLYRVTVERRQ
ncbi:MAG TPA: hypothetical protein VKR83_01575 [Ktedonobacteraceae bacterium]|nr:hypothetical protein [Ktedonobacteraceae bacterium]